MGDIDKLQISVGQKIPIALYQIFIVLALASYLFIVLTLLGNILGLIITFVVKIIFRKRGIYLFVKRINISLLNFSIKIQGIEFANHQFSLQIQDIFIKYELTKLVNVYSQKQFESILQFNAKHTDKYDTSLMKAPLSVTISGLEIHLYNRPKKEIPISKDANHKQQKPVQKQIPIIFQLIPAITIKCKGARAILGNNYMRLLAVANLPQFSLIISTQSLQTQDPFQYVVDGIIDQMNYQDSREDVKLHFVENFQYGRSGEDWQRNFMNVQSQMLSVPIAQVNRIHVTMNLVQGGLNDGESSDAFSDAKWPVLQVHLRLHRAALAFSGWIYTELMKIINYFKPTVIEEASPVDFRALQFRINKAMYIGVYLDDHSYVKYMNRNEALPNRPELNDPIINWRYKQAKQRQQHIYSNKSQNFRGSMKQQERKQKDVKDLDESVYERSKVSNLNNQHNHNKNKGNFIQNSVEKRSSAKMYKFYQLYSLNYDKISKQYEEMSPKVPEVKDYFNDQQYLYLKLHSFSQVQIRIASQFFKDGENGKPQNSGMKILIRSPCVRGKNKLIQQEIISVDDLEFLIDLQNQLESKNLSTMEMGINIRNLQLDLNKITLDHIMNLVKDITTTQNTKEIYDALEYQIPDYKLPDNVLFVPKLMKVQLTIANYEISCNIQKNNCYTELYNITGMCPTQQYLQNEAAFSKYIQKKEASTYFNYYSNDRQQFNALQNNLQFQLPITNTHMYITPAHHGMENVTCQTMEQQMLWYKYIYEHQNDVSESDIKQLIVNRNYTQQIYPRFIVCGVFGQMKMQADTRQFHQHGSYYTLQKNNEFESSYNYKQLTTIIEFKLENPGIFVQMGRGSFLSNFIPQPFSDLKIAHAKLFGLNVILNNTFQLQNNKTPKNYIKILMQLEQCSICINIYVINIIARYVARLASEFAYYIRPEDSILYNFYNIIAQLFSDQSYIESHQFNQKQYTQRLLNAYRDEIQLEQYNVDQDMDDEQADLNDLRISKTSFSQYFDDDIKAFTINSKNLKYAENQKSYYTTGIPQRDKSQFTFQLDLSDGSIIASDNLITEVERNDRKRQLPQSRPILVIHTHCVKVYLIDNNQNRMITVTSSPLVGKLGILKHNNQESSIQRTLYDKYFPKVSDYHSQMDEIICVSGAYVSIEDVMKEESIFEQPCLRQINVQIPNASINIETSQISQLIQLSNPFIQSIQINCQNHEFDALYFTKCLDVIKNVPIREPIQYKQNQKPFTSLNILICSAKVTCKDTHTHIIHQIDVDNGINIFKYNTFSFVTSDYDVKQISQATEIIIKFIEYSQLVNGQINDPILKANVEVNIYENNNDELEETIDMVSCFTQNLQENEIPTYDDEFYDSSQMIDVSQDQFGEFCIIRQVPKEHILYGYKYDPNYKKDDELNSEFIIEYEHRNENSPLQRLRNVEGVSLQNKAFQNLKKVEIKIDTLNAIVMPTQVNSILSIVQQIQFIRIEVIEDILSMYYKQWSKKFEFNEIKMLNSQLMEKYEMKSMQSLYDNFQLNNNNKIYSQLEFTICKGSIDLKLQSVENQRLKVDLNNVCVGVAQKIIIQQYNFYILKFLDYVDALGQLNSKKLSIQNNKSSQKQKLQISKIDIQLIQQNEEYIETVSSILDISDIKQDLNTNFLLSENVETKLIQFKFKPLNINCTLQVFDYVFKLIMEFQLNNKKKINNVKSNNSIIIKSIIEYFNSLGEISYNEYLQKMFTDSYKQSSNNDLFKDIINNTQKFISQNIKIDNKTNYLDRKYSQFQQIQQLLQFSQSIVEKKSKTINIQIYILTQDTTIYLSEDKQSYFSMKPIGLVLCLTTQTKQANKQIKVILKQNGLEAYAIPDTLVQYLLQINKVKSEFSEQPQQHDVLQIQQQQTHQNKEVASLDQQIQQTKQENVLIKKLLRAVNDQKIIMNLLVQIDYAKVTLLLRLPKLDSMQQDSYYCKSEINKIMVQLITQQGITYSNTYLQFGIDDTSIMYCKRLQDLESQSQNIKLDRIKITLKSKELIKSTKNKLNNVLTNIEIYLGGLYVDINQFSTQLSQLFGYLLEQKYIIQAKLIRKQTPLTQVDLQQSIVQNIPIGVKQLPPFIFQFIIHTIQVKVEDDLSISCQLNNCMTVAQYKENITKTLHSIAYLPSGNINFNASMIQNSQQFIFSFPEVYYKVSYSLVKNQIQNNIKLNFKKNIFSYKIINIAQRFVFKIIQSNYYLNVYKKLHTVSANTLVSEVKVQPISQKASKTFYLEADSNPIEIQLIFPDCMIYFGIDEIQFKVMNQKHDLKNIKSVILPTSLNQKRVYTSVAIKNIKAVVTQQKLKNDLSKLDICQVVQFENYDDNNTQTQNMNYLLTLMDNQEETNVSLTLQCTVSVSLDFVHDNMSLTLSLDTCKSNMHFMLIYQLMQMIYQIKLGVQDIVVKQQEYQFFNKTAVNKQKHKTLRNNFIARIVVKNVELQVFTLHKTVVNTSVNNLNLTFKNLKTYQFDEDTKMIERRVMQIRHDDIKLQLIEEQFDQKLGKKIINATQTELIIKFNIQLINGYELKMIKNQCNIILDQLTFKGDHHTPYLLYIILTDMLYYIKQKILYDQDYITQHQPQSTTINKLSEASIEYVKHLDSRLLLQIMVKQISVELAYTANNDMLQFGISNISTIIEANFKDILNKSGKLAYTSEHTTRELSNLMRQYNLGYMKIDCKQKVSTNIICSLRKQQITLPQKIFDFLTQSMYEFSAKNTTIDQSVINFSAIQPGEKQLENLQRKMQIVQQKIDNFVIKHKKNSVKLIINLQEIQINITAATLEQGQPNQSLLVTKLENLNIQFVVKQESTTDQQISLILDLQQFYIYVCNQIMEEYISVYTNRCQRIPDFAIPCLVQISDISIYLNKLRKITNLDVNFEKIFAQITPPAFQNIAILYYVWNGNIKTIKKQIKEINTQHEERSSKDNKSPKAKRILINARAMLQNINLKYLEVESFDFPNIEFTGNDKDTNIKENKMIVQLKVLKQNYDQVKNDIQLCTNEKPIILQFGGRKNPLCLAQIQEITTHLQFSNHLMNFNIHDLTLFFTNKYFEFSKEINIFAMAEIKKLAVDCFASYEIANCVLKGIQFNAKKLADKNTVNIQLDNIQMFLGLDICKEMSEIIQHISKKVKYNWQVGQDITQGFKSSKSKLYVYQNIDQLSAEANEFIGESIGNSLYTSIQSTVNNQLSSTEIKKKKFITTMFDDIFSHIIKTQFNVNISKAQFALSPSNLGQDTLLAATLIRAQFLCDLKLISNVQKQSIEKFSIKNEAQNLLEIIGKEIRQNITFSISQLVAENVFHLREHINGEDKTLLTYDHQGTTYLYCKCFLECAQEQQKQNIITMRDNKWTIEQKNYLLNGKYRYLASEVSILTKPGSFQNSSELFAAIENIIQMVRRIMDFKNQFKKSNSKKKSRPKVNSEIINGYKVLNRGQDDIPVLQFVKTGEIQKILPHITLLGQGTVMVENTVRALALGKADNTIAQHIAMVDIQVLRFISSIDQNLCAALQRLDRMLTDRQAQAEELQDQNKDAIDM